MKKVLLFFTLFGFNYVMQAQTPNDIVKKAMQDELQRSMKELQMETYDKPFYISYQISDHQSTNIAASLGALLYSAQQPGRTKNVRVMVGDYEFNDESLDTNINQDTQNYDRFDFAVPLGDDYYGIRRSLWKTTDEVYKSAAKIFRENKNYVERQDKPLKEVPHRRFAKTPTVKLTSSQEKVTIDSKYLEDMARDISRVFLKYPDLENSIVSIRVSEQTDHFIDSEGSDITAQDNLLQLNIYLNKSTSTEIIDNLTYLVNHPEQLPDMEHVNGDIAKMVERISKLEEAPVFDDSYEGPVLFTGVSVARLFSRQLMNFVASDLDLSTNGVDYMAYNNSRNNLDDKIGKKVTSDNLSITLKPSLKEYNGTALLGYYEVDNEGVKPPQELKLVDKGVLKDVMTSRTLTKEQHKANGTNSGPGVVLVESSNKLEDKKLKEKLLELAEEEGLDYAIMVNNMDQAYNFDIVKITLDGKEELIRKAYLRDFDLKSLRKIYGTNTTTEVHNLSGSGAGNIVSMITPGSMLIEDVELEGSSGGRPPMQEPLVPNPLKAD